MRSIRRTLAAALPVAFAVACGGQHNASDGFDGGSSTYALTLVGSANYVVHPTEKRTLQVLLSQDQVGPVANASLHFEFQDGDPAGAKLDNTDVVTDANGIGTIHFQAGTASGKPSFKVVASAPSYGPGPVAFSFNVIPIRTYLTIVATQTTHVNPDGLSASTLIGVNNSVALKVLERDADTNAPIVKDKMTFTLPPKAASVSGAPYWSSGTASLETSTTAGGEAQAFLQTRSDTANSPWLVTVQSGSGSAGATFSVTVQNSSGAPCTTNTQCPQGEVCAGSPPTCQPGGGSTGCDNGSDNGCPNGWLCVMGVCQPPTGGQCDPAAPNCANGQCCDASTNACINECPTTCPAGSHCQPGTTCGQGQCVTDNTVPDVTGTWLTKHTYSIKDALPPVLQDVFYAIRVIDQALLGKLTITGIPWIDKIINAIVSKLLQQYLPDWLQQVIHISDDIVTILSDLRSEGSMRLSRATDLAHLKGTEVWSSLVFYWLPLCNGNIGGDPCVPPECARLDIATVDSSNPGEVGQCKGQSLPTITVQAKPFTATVVGTGSGGSAPYQLNVDQRQVNVEMGKVLLVLVDTLISLVTPYHCIDEITDCTPGPGNCPLIDCYGLGQDVEGATGGLVPGDTIEAICDGVVTAAGQAVTQLLAGAWPITADVLDFNGRASISGTAPLADCDSGSGATCALQLGNENYDKDLGGACFAAPKETRDGYWTGDFFFKILHKLPGAWEGVRPQ